jgi:coenzyme F420 hydrogenase subunit beta
MALISYKDLKEKVWDVDKCCGCGACVGVCPTEALYFDSNDAKSPTSNDYCKVTRDSVPCGACFSACPRTELVETSGFGTIVSLYQSKSNINVPYAQAGGVVSALLLAARERGLIDAVILMDVDRWNQKSEPKFAATLDEILAASGSRYVWAPILKVLREAIEERKLKKIAIVGTPCVMSAVRKIRESDLDVLSIYKRAIRLSLGLFCTEIFTDQLLEKLEKEFNVNAFDIKSLDVKGKLIVTLINSRKVEIPLKDIGDVKKQGCESCIDFTSEDADLSLGAIGAESGFTVVIVRNKTGEGFLKLAASGGYITLKRGVNVEALAKIGAKKKRIPIDAVREALERSAQVEII